MGAVSLIRTGDYTASPEPEPDPLSAGSISASAGDGEVAISEGTAPSGGSGAYTRQLYRSTSGGSKGSAISGATSLPYTDEGLTNDTEYFYTLEVGDGVDTADTAQVSATPVEPSGEHPNEPVGMTTLLDRSFATEDETDAAGETWVDSSASSGTPQIFSIATDATAPKSPSGVGRILYPTGHPGSGSSSQTARSTGGFTRLDTAGQQLYLEWWWKISDNYYGHSGGQNKIFYIGHPIVVEFGYESGRGGTTDDPYFNWTFATQGGATLNYRCTTSGNEVSPTLEQARVLRDTWYHNELLLTMNTPGVANGSFRFWQNEVEIMRWTNSVNILRGDTSQYSYIQSLDWHPIYGGQDGESVPEAQSQYIDHIYASGGF